MDETQGRFLALLKQEETALEELHDLLQQETNALKSRDNDRVNELIEAKNMLLNRLGMLDKQRQLFTNNDKTSLLVDKAFNHQLNKLNDKIKSSLDKCKHQNKINGGIIEMGRMFNEKILDIICGNEKNSTYSAEGKNSSRNTQHSIARV